MSDICFNRIDSIFNDVNSVISEGLDELTKIRMDEYERYNELRNEYRAAQAQFEEVMEANESCGKECLRARDFLVAATRSGDESEQREAYFRVEHLMKLRGSLEEREKNLRVMRDHLAREIRRREDTLQRTEELGTRFRMAIEILDSGRKIETPEKDGILAAAIAMAEREGSHLARELHDGPAQKFGVASMSVDIVEQYLLSGLTDRAMEEVRSLRGVLADADEEVRAFLHRLNPPGLDQGIDVALKRLVDRLSERHGLESVVTVDGTGWHMPLYMRANIFKIVYQALMNAIRNGKAKKIAVRISMGKDAFRAMVQDDGIGFDVDQAKVAADQRGSYGLRNMEERASLAGGDLTIESQPGRGTTIRLRVPMKGRGFE